MKSIEETLGRLEQLGSPDRRLDAEITAWALAPSGWTLDPIEDLDGFGIALSSEWPGETEFWMCAADVPYVTRYMDAAMELIASARPLEASLIAMRAFARLLKQPSCGPDFSQRAACQMVAELLRALCVSAQTADVSAQRSAA